MKRKRTTVYVTQYHVTNDYNTDVVEVWPSLKAAARDFNLSLKTTLELLQFMDSDTKKTDCKTFRIPAKVVKENEGKMFNWSWSATDSDRDKHSIILFSRRI